MEFDDILDDGNEHRIVDEDDYAAIIDVKRKIFEEEKKVKNGKIVIGIMIGLAIISLIYSISIGVEMEYVLIDAIVLLGSYIFGFIYCDINPKIAFGVVLGVYLVFQVIILMMAPIAMLAGLLFKFVFIYFLAMGLQGGIRLEELRRRLSRLGAD